MNLCEIFNKNKTNKKKFEIKITRDNIGIENDSENHLKLMYLSKNSTYKELVKILIKEKYFPKIQDTNAVWVFNTAECECICSYYTLTNKIFSEISEKRLGEICKTSNTIIIEYYESPLKWKEKITAMYNNDTYLMWKDGWLEEYKYCDYINSLKNSSQEYKK